MARLKAVSKESASPEVRSVYDRVKARFEKLVETVSVNAAHLEIFNAYKRMSWPLSIVTAAGLIPAGRRKDQHQHACPRNAMIATQM